MQTKKVIKLKSLTLIKNIFVKHILKIILTKYLL